MENLRKLYEGCETIGAVRSNGETSGVLGDTKIPIIFVWECGGETPPTGNQNANTDYIL